jgi:hypothetical protein
MQPARLRNKLNVMRGATMVEYRNLGKSARKNADESSSALLER